MDALTLVLLLTIAVLISAVIDQIVPKVSLPLIQIAMGVLIAVAASDTIKIELDPDLFLVLFIAPLLYIEAKDADKTALWKNKAPILSLAIGLVVVTTLVVGFGLHLLVPSIPLAAAFALGAALGPTDAVAVTSLSKQISIPERQWSTLKGELLLNDASGIVSFQFALAAVVSGTFSIVDATGTFLLEFFGGIIVGAAVGYFANLILRKIRDIGIESNTFHVLYELCIPFVVYLLAESLEISGIIAVVVAGLVNVIAPRTISPAIARMNIVSSNVWEVLSFALNGIVFVMLGTQLPAAMTYSWEDSSISNFTLVALVLAVTFALYLVRFLWCGGMEFAHVRKVRAKARRSYEDGTYVGKDGLQEDLALKFGGKNVKEALITTLCGAKGTITLSILFTIPVFIGTGERFPERSLIIFLGCGVILCTLLIATFIVPLIAPKRAVRASEVEARLNYYEVLSDVLRAVIEELTAQQTKETRKATRAVIKAYQDRLESVKPELDADESVEEISYRRVRLMCLRWEEECALAQIAQGKVRRAIGYEYLTRIERTVSLLTHEASKFSFKRISKSVRVGVSRAKMFIVKALPGAKLSEENAEMRNLRVECARSVVAHLKDEMGQGSVAVEDASKIILDYEKLISDSTSSLQTVTKSLIIMDESEDIRRMAFQIELEQIQLMFEDDRITRKEAKKMRDNVFLMQMDLG